MNTYSKRMALFIQRLGDVLPWAQIEEAGAKTHEYGMPTEAYLSGREKDLALRLGYGFDEVDQLRKETNEAMAARIWELEKELKEAQEKIRDQDYQLADWRLAGKLPLERARLELKRAADAALAELSKPEKEQE